MLYRSILRPLLFRLPPETAHELALHALTAGFGAGAARRAARRRLARPLFGELRRFGLRFENPVGVAAGFDKNGVAAHALAALGFGFVEVGTVTRLAQPGNPRPRLFRLPLDRALINRLGFNNAGAAALAERLNGSGKPPCVLGVNIGKSRVVAVEEAAADYLASFDLIHPHADYVAVNVSSPNTPGLRELQRADLLAGLLGELQRRNGELSERAGRERTPLLVKVAPDLGAGELELIVDVAKRVGFAGIIATNTTVSRDGLKTPRGRVESFGDGGLSGAPLRSRSTQVVAALHRLSRGALEIVGVGGVFNAEDAWEKISAGASLVQLYTGFVYEGAGVVARINEGLAAILSRHGLSGLDEAVGCRADELAARASL
ncbi:MAG TPA: quinone-dependent dihydroorotate dehydrogenase [Pyrinomonadaceae bacterium]|jgi:dihydroorotate dehydrogenase|nr:quinone-dependent dihydroorotate dehydrogenase [Pyrinomonadaceae bacterium]